MAVTQEELGRRLREAREACGMTQDDVAKHLGVSRPTVTQLENGKRPVSTLELDRLARLFGRDLREFVGEEFSAEKTLAALFRGHVEATQESAVQERLRNTIWLARELTNLEEVLSVDRSSASAPSYRVPTPSTKWDAVVQGSRASEEERRRLGLGALPLAGMTDLLESQGVHAFLVELPDDISGVTMNDPRMGLIVIANTWDSALRCRFSLAHEYAHLLFDRERFGILSRTSDRDDLAEVRANSFAAAFLMPEEGVRAFLAGLGKGRPSRASAQVFDEHGALPAEGRTAPGSQDVQLVDVVRLAHNFGVSRLAALYRLLNLKLVTRPEFDALKTEEEQKGAQAAKLLGIDKPTHDDIQAQLRQRVLNLGLEALRRQLITRAKLLELADAMSFSGSSAAELARWVVGNEGDRDGDVLLPEGEA